MKKFVRCKRKVVPISNLVFLRKKDPKWRLSTAAELVSRIQLPELLFHYSVCFYIVYSVCQSERQLSTYQTKLTRVNIKSC